MQRGPRPTLLPHRAQAPDQAAAGSTGSFPLELTHASLVGDQGFAATALKLLREVGEVRARPIQDQNKLGEGTCKAAGEGKEGEPPGRSFATDPDPRGSPRPGSGRKVVVFHSLLPAQLVLEWGKAKFEGWGHALVLIS